MTAGRLVALAAALAIITPALASAPARAQAPAPTVVFNFEFDNTSPQPTQPDEKARLKDLDTQLATLLRKYGCCRIIPPDEAAAGTTLWNCNGCDVDLARSAGGRISVVGWVQKVSNLILNINLRATDVATGRVIEQGSVDIRGNTQESWSRGLAYLLRNRLHPSQWQ